jgi:hypothetical protein
MINNKELYSFGPEPGPAEPQTELNSQEEAYTEFNFITKLLHQTIITVCCLILLLTISHVNMPWSRWIKDRIHFAIHSSQEMTFGRIGNSRLWQTMVTNAGNLVRLEEITKNLTEPEIAVTSPVKKIFLNSVWPVQGSITKGYGWRYNPVSKMREFNAGIEITAIPNTVVLAIADGTIGAIKHQPGMGWQIVINHGDGWSSYYYYLGLVNVMVGQKVKAGDPVAQISRPDQDKGPALLLEIKEYGQPVDPLSILVS